MLQQLKGKVKQHPPQSYATPLGVVVMLFRLKGAILVHMDPRVIVLTFASYYAVVDSRASVNNATISGEAG